MLKDHFEKIVDVLVRLKDTSELMLDLAYSSLLLNSRELAEEVKALEQHMDNMHTNFELLVLSSGFTKQESKNFLGLIRLGVVTERIADAAAELAEVVLRDLEPHPILKLVIKEAEETVSSSKVTSNSFLVGKKLKEARIPEQTGMWVLVVKRGKKWMRPKSNPVIQAGDIIIASGYSEGEEDFKKLVAGI